MTDRLAALEFERRTVAAVIAQATGRDPARAEQHPWRDRLMTLVMLCHMARRAA